MQFEQKRYVVTLAPSKYLLSYLIIVHCIMAVTIAHLLPLNLIIILVSVMLMHLLFELKRFGWLGSSQIIQRVELNLTGDVLAYDQQQQKKVYRLTRSYACRWFIILTLSSTNTRLKTQLFICNDSVDKQLFRKLLVCLVEPKLYQQ